jgi:autotransporter adhesin
LVWNRSLRAPVVASELATRSVSGSSRTQAGPQALTGVLAGAVMALLAIPPDAEAIVGITRKAVNGTTCESDADEGNHLWNVVDDGRCHPKAGKGPSGVGDPGTNVIIYSSKGTTGTEDSIAIGGYLDVWKPATFWGGIDMRGNTISNLKPGEKEGDAATVGQVNKVAGDLANIANGGGIKYFRAKSSLADAVVSGSDSVAIGPQANASASDAVALGSGAVADRANTVSVGSTTKQRQIVNVAKGAQDTDAVNVSQLKGVTDALGGGSKVNPDGTVTGPAYTVGGKTVNNVGDAITHLGDQINNGEMGLVKQDATSKAVTVAKETGGKLVDLKGTEGERVLTGVADGSIADGSKDAVTGGQLYNAEKATADALGGGAKVNPDGSVTGPTYTVGGKTVNNVGDAIEGMDGRVTNVDGRVTQLGDQINNGEIGLVKQDATSRKITVAKEQDGTQVDFTGTAGTRVLNGVSKGAITATSVEAINGSQLYGTNKSLADGLGGGSKVNPDGTVSGPTYTVGGKTVNNVGDAITHLGDQISNVSADGLVKQDLTTRDITVGKDSNGKKVDLKGTEGERVLTGVADGSIADGSKDAVTGGQLYNAEKATADALGGGAKVNPDGTVTGPTYTVGGKTVNNVGDAITNVDGRVTNVDGRVTQLGDQINNGEIGLVKQDATSRKITVAKDTDGTQVDFTGTAGTRVLNGVSKGALTATSVEAVNGSQLYGSNKTMADALGGGSKLNPDGTVSGPSYTVGGKTVNNVGDAISNLGDQINNVSADGLVKQDLTTREITVGKDSNGKKVDLKGTEGERVLTGVADGSVAQGSKDAVTGGQLYNAEKATADALGGGAKINPDGTVTGPTYTVGGKTVNNVGDAITNVDGRVTNLGDQINNGEIGLVKQDATSRKITVAKDTDGTQVDFTGIAGTRVLNGVSKGAVNQSSVEAINGAQLYGTNKSLADGLGGGSKVNPDGTVSGPTYTVGGKTVNNVGDAISNLGDQINNVSADGLVKQDLTTREITVGKDSNGKKIDLKGSEGERVLTGVADGSVAQGSKDAVTGGQLYNAEKATADALGGGAKVNPDGTVTGPIYTVGGKTVNNVGDAITNVDGRVTNVDGRVTHLGDQINNGQIGLVKQDATSRKITVAQEQDGTQVDFTGTAGTRVLNGVSKGAVNQSSVEAINGAQLYGTSKSTADALGGGAKVNPDGTVSGPTYTIGGKTVNNVGDAISNLGDQINNVSADGLVKQDLTTREITVGKDSNGKKVDLKGTEGERVLTGVADGSIVQGSKDAVTGGQLYNAEKATADALGGGAKVNPDGTVTGPTYTVGGKTVNNVGDAIDNVDGRITTVGDTVNNIVNGGGIKYFRANSSLADAVASGSDSVAMGPQANASAADAVALGSGALADRANTVSVGSTAKQRQIVNVAKGTQDTDAVNVSQLKGVTDALGGGSKVNPDGTVSGPTYNIGGKTVTNVGDAITNLGDQINNVSADGLVKQDLATRDITVGKDSNGKKVDLKGTEGERVLTGVADGSVAQGSKDAVTGGQLYNAGKATTDALGGGAKLNPDGTVTGPTYTVGGKTVNNVGDAITNVDGRVINIDDRVTHMGDQINNGEIGLVKQDANSKAVTVAKETGGKLVDLKGTEGERVLTGVADGSIAQGSKDAVTGGQLYNAEKATADALGGGAKVNPDGTVTGPTYTVGGKTVNNVGDAITNVDGRVTHLGDQITNGEIGLVKQDATSRKITVAKEQDGTQVDFTGTAGTRVLTGVSKGAVDQSSVEAINGAQLYGTSKSIADALGGGAKVNPDGTVSGPTYNVGGKIVNNVGDAITHVDGRVTNIDDRVTHLGDQIINGQVGLVKQDATSKAVTVAKETGGKLVDLKGTEGERVLTGVADGSVAQGSKDAITGGQLYNAEKATADALGGGAKVNPDGTLMGPTYTIGGKKVNTVGDALTEVDGRVTNVDNRVTQLGDQINGGKGIKYFHANSSLADALASGMDSVAIGPMAVAHAANAVALGKGAVADRANTVSVGAAGSERQIVNVAKGTQDTDAVNVSQLKGVTDSLGGGAKLNPDGSVSGPTYNIGGKTVTNVGDAITHLGDQITNVSADGLVKQDPSSRDITVGAQADGKRVDFRGTQGDRVLAGVANGAVSANSNEAVNGAQMHGLAKSVADGLGGGAKVNPDGSVTGPTYNVDGRTVNNAGDAITNIDARVTHNTQAIKSITEGAGVKYFHANATGPDSVASGADAIAAGPSAQASGNGSVAVGSGAQAQAGNSVALGAGSVAVKADTVSVGRTGQERTISHVAAGQADTDAVNVSQLKSAQAGSIRYDAPAPGGTPDHGTLSLGGPGGNGTTVVRNVATGKAPNDAVNVQQLQDGMSQTLGKANSYTDSRFQQVKEDAWQSRREARGGTAAAMAMAGMPQAYLPGANMLSAGVGSFQGEAAMAVGLSGVTDNGRYVYKAQASGNTRGEFGFSVGAGIQW